MYCVLNAHTKSKDLDNNIAFHGLVFAKFFTLLISPWTVQNLVLENKNKTFVKNTKKNQGQSIPPDWRLIGGHKT